MSINASSNGLPKLVSSNALFISSFNELIRFLVPFSASNLIFSSKISNKLLSEMILSILDFNNESI